MDIYQGRKLTYCFLQSSFNLNKLLILLTLLYSKLPYSVNFNDRCPKYLINSIDYNVHI